MCMGFTRAKFIPKRYICQKCQWATDGEEDDEIILSQPTKRAKTHKETEEARECGNPVTPTNTYYVPMEESSGTGPLWSDEVDIDLKNKSEDQECSREEGVPRDIHVCHLCQVVCDSLLGVSIISHLLLCHPTLCTVHFAAENKVVIQRDSDHHHVELPSDLSLLGYPASLPSSPSLDEFVSESYNIIMWQTKELLIKQVHSPERLAIQVASFSPSGDDVSVSLSVRIWNGRKIVFSWKGSPYPYTSLSLNEEDYAMEMSFDSKSWVAEELTVCLHRKALEQDNLKHENE
jgi:hypothetical protein